MYNKTSAANRSACFCGFCVINFEFSFQIATCDLCGKKMLKKALNRHSNIFHNEAAELEAVRCPVCFAIYQTVWNYNVHFKKDHAPAMKMRPQDERYRVPTRHCKGAKSALQTAEEG